MNFKTTYILFGVLLVLLVTLGIALYIEPLPPEAGTYILPSVHLKDKEMKAEDVTRVEIQRSRPNEEKIVLEREGESKTWRITEPHTLRADSFAVTGLVRDVLDAQRDTGADVPQTLKDAGLEPPAATVTLSKDGREVKLNVGDTSPPGENQVVFVTSSDNPKQGAPVRKSRLEGVFKKLNDFRDRTLLANSDGDLKSIKLSEAKKQAVALTKEKEALWKYTEPPYGVAEMEGEPAPPSGAPPADKAPTGVRPLLNDLTALRVDKSEDFVADDVADKDLGKYNLDPEKNAILRVEVEKSEGTKEDAKTTKVALLIGVDKAVDGKYYARIDGEKSIVRVPAKEVDPLRKFLDDPGALRDRNLVRLENLKTPDAIQIKNAASTFELLHEDGPKAWQLYRGDNAVKADEKAVQNVITKLTQKNIVRDFPATTSSPASLGLDKPSTIVSVWVDGIAKEEKKDEKPEEKKEEKKDDKKDDKKEEKKPAKPKLKDPEKPTVRLSFGNVDGNLVAVKRESAGETILMRVPVDILENLRHGPLTYMDRTLPKMGDTDPAQSATKLVLVRNGVTTELSKDAKATPPAWKIDKPENLAGRTADPAAVDGILRMLNNLRAVKLVTESAEGEAVDREYGLKSPATKVIVTLAKDGKTTDYQYEFGKEADATKTYARQGQRPNLVFEVDKADLAALSKDLQDPTVFRFDPSKAKTLKLTGWKDINGSPTTREFERKDSTTWIAKVPKDFSVSSEKVNRLVFELSSERAVKFLDHKLTAKERDDDALSPEKGGLAIEVTVDGEKEPFILTVGNLDADKAAYLATANRLGDSLFTVRKDVYEKPKEKPAYFNP